MYGALKLPQRTRCTKDKAARAMQGEVLQLINLGNLSPKPETRNQKPGTRHPKSHTRLAGPRLPPASAALQVRLLWVGEFRHNTLNKVGATLGYIAGSKITRGPVQMLSNSSFPGTMPARISYSPGTKPVRFSQVSRGSRANRRC